MSGMLEQTNWRVTQQLSRQGAKFDFLLANEAAITVNELDRFTLTDPALGATLFDGMLVHAEEELVAPRFWGWRCQGIDWTYFLDHRHVVGSFGTLTADQVIAQLFMNFPCGISQNHVSVAPVLTALTIHHMTFSRALNRIASMVSSPISNWSWYVDYNKDLHFFDQATATPATFYLSDNLSDSSASRVLYDRPNYRRIIDASNIRTNIVVRGGVVTSNVQTDTFVGNGQSRAFPLTYVPFATTGTSSSFPPTLTVGGTSKTVAFDTGGSGQSAQWLISPNKAGVYFLVPNTDPTPANTVVVVLQYKYQLPVQQVVTHLGAVTKYRSAAGANHDGKFDVIIEDPNLVDAITAIQRGQRELQGYAFAERRLTIKTTPADGHTQPDHHFDAGTLVNVTNAQDGLSNVQYLVFSNTIQGEPGGLRSYSMDLVQVSGS